MRCAIYARVSTDKQGDSVDHQVSLLREVARSRGEDWTVQDEHVYEDSGVSATKQSIWTRPAMKRLLCAAQQRQFGVVLFKGISRFARNTAEALQVLDRLKAKGLRVVSYEENYDSANENSNFMFTMHAAIAEYEAEKIGVRVRLGNKEKARSGRFVGGTPPLGYLVDEDGRLAIDAGKADLVRLIFRLYADKGQGCCRIAQHLNDLGYRTNTGALWQKGGIARILSNDAYVGDLVYNRFTDKSVRDYDSPIPGKRKETRSRNPETEWVVVRDAHPALVSRISFLRAAERRSAHRPGGVVPKSVHLLTGLLRCGHCGERMIAQSRRNKDKVYRYYVCRTYHRSGRSACPQPNLQAAELESLILLRLERWVRASADGANIGRRLRLSQAQQHTHVDAKAALQRQWQKTLHDSARLYAEREHMEPAQYAYVRRQLREQSQRLVERLAAAEAERALIEPDAGAALAATFQDLLEPERLAADVKHRFVRHFIASIEAREHRISICYTFCSPRSPRIDGDV